MSACSVTRRASEILVRINTQREDYLSAITECWLSHQPQLDRKLIQSHDPIICSHRKVGNAHTTLHTSLCISSTVVLTPTCWWWCMRAAEILQFFHSSYICAHCRLRTSISRKNGALIVGLVCTLLNLGSEPFRLRSACRTAKWDT